MKILGLDVGERRIGVALAEGKLVATYGIIDNSNLDEAIREIGKIVREEGATKIIIGLPKFPDPVQSDKIYKFAQILGQNLNVEIEFTDETLTTKEAENELQGKLEPQSPKFKEEVDKLAAKYILEQYLHHQ